MGSLSFNDSCSNHRHILDWIESYESTSPFPDQQPISRKRRRDQDQTDDIGNTPRKERALHVVTGNIMTSRRRSPRKQQREDDEHTPGSERVSSVIQGLENSASDVANDTTPRPHGSKSLTLLERNSATMIPPPVYNPPPSNAPTSTYDSENSASSTRSRSPVKDFADLRMADIPTVYLGLSGKVAEETGGILRKYRCLRKASLGIGVIPHTLQSFIEESLHRDDWPPPHAYATQQNPTLLEEQVYDRKLGEQAVEICSQAEICDKERYSEAEWNSRVQGPLLALVVRNPRHRSAVGQMNITSARIQPAALSMQHQSGSKMQNKMVDYAVYLHPSESMERKIQNTLRGQLPGAQSVNQTMTSSLRQRPIAINMETKVPFSGGETADVQLAIWMGAGITRLRQLLSGNGNQGEDVPAMPVLSMHGHDLHLSVFKAFQHQNILYGKLRLGGSDTLLGFFQMVEALNILVEWANEDFRNWYETKVLMTDI